MLWRGLLGARRNLSILVLALLVVAVAGCGRESSPEAEIRAETRTAAPGQATGEALPPAPERASATSIMPESTGEEATVSVPAATTRPGETPSPQVTISPAATQATSDLQLEVPEGALIAVSMPGRVGVLLDEIPEVMRDRVAGALADRPASFWDSLARRQVHLTERRLNFRNFVYEGKGQLPLPPEPLWSITLDTSGPARRTIQGHDLVIHDYDFSSTLLTDAVSPGTTEPALAQIGGVWVEPFILPLDPDLLLQRTGNACLNESGFPPNSYDSENAWVFYDFACQADSGGELGCHRTRLNSRSCLQALDDQIGQVETTLTFERLAWDKNLADSVRLGAVPHLVGPDLSVVSDDLNNNRVIYRYFPADSCALLEQCVGGSGWRRLLQFDATVHNVGSEPLHIGPVVAEDPEHNLFQYNACHNHFHFSDYGDFYFADAERNISSKQAFCVESTGRLSNNEFSPLTHEYSCTFQGVQAGWVDEYHAGLDCQWIDITGVNLPDDGSPVALGFISNPDRFLCEGAPVLDAQGELLWEPSGLTSENGRPIERPQCDFVPDWDANNSGSAEVLISAAGSFVTAPCNQEQIGPLRNCGFEEAAGFVQEEDGPADTGACRPGQTIQLACSLEDGAAPQVIRLCEYSDALGVGVACAYEDALANVVVDQAQTDVAFTCPFARDETEPGGRYALYTAPVFGDDSPAPVTCTAQ